jgi:hypothetical protein
MDPVLLQRLIEAVVLAIVSLLAFVLRQVAVIGIAYLQQRLGVEQLAELKEIAQTVVRTLAQSPIFEALDPARKKEMAVVDIVTYCENHGLPVDHGLIDRLIEEAVQIMKAELGNINPGLDRYGYVN